MTCRIKNGLIKVMLFICLLSFALGMQSIFGVTVKAADSSIISMTAGASVNVTSSENAGLRFQAKVDKTAYDALAQTDGVTKVELGMMTVPTDMVKDAANNGKEFTIEGLSSYTPLDGYDYYSIATEIVTVGDYYYFKMTIPGISEKNYNRDFSARAFIKVTATALDNAEFALYDGAYYSYAPYNEEDNARCVYEVAYKTYTDRTTDYDNNHQNELNDGTFGVVSDEGLAIAKTFIDGVAVVENNDGMVEIANNHEYYTSPYTVEKSGDNYFVSADPAGLTYNGARCKNLYAVDGKTMVSSLLSKGATLTANGASIDSTGSVVAPGYFSQTLDKIMDNNYIAVAGEYGVGTYMDFYFNGNNMPSVMFFADKINGNMSGYASYTGANVTAAGVASNEKGLLITNGFQGQNANAVANGTRDYFMVYGPNRMYLNTTSIGVTLASKVTSTALINKAYFSTDTQYNAFTQTALRNEYYTTNFKYTIGTYDNNGELMVDATLYDVDNEQVVGIIRESTGLTTSSITEGNIVIYGSVKGSSETTSFTYTKPYQSSASIVSSGATFNADGSVTIAQATQGGDGGVNHVYQRTGDQHKYIAFKGDYGVGTYMDFTFTGANMPQVTFFANNINGYILNYHSFDNTSKVGNASDDTGVVLSNGLWTTDNHGQHYFTVWGPNKIKFSDDLVSGAYQYKTDYLFRDTQDSPMSYSTLNSTYATTKLKYVVGTFDKDGYLGIDARLYNADTGAIIYCINQVTSLATSEVTADNIIVYGMPKAGTTTFTYSEPYQSEPSVFVNGATFNTDQTVTLAGNVSAGGYAYHVGQHTNSYIGIKGNYGIGTYIDVTYTGNNMPNIMFFADDINGTLTSDGGKGVLLMNGIVCANTNSSDIRALGIYGPNRINKSGVAETSNTYSDNVSRIARLLGYSWNATTSSYDVADYPYLCQMGLDTTADVTYKLTVGTLVSDTGKLIIDIYLYSVTADSVVYDVQVETTLSAGEVEAGSIVLYGAVKGSANATTFSYGEPYMSEDFSENILSFETTSSATFTALNSGNAQISTDKAFQGARSLKVSALSQVTAFNLYGFKPLDGYNQNDLISVNAYVYLDAPAGASLLMTDKNGNAYTYLDAAQTAVSAGAWTSVTVDIPVGYDTANYLEIAFKISGADDLSAVSVYVDNIQIQYNSLLGYSLYRTQAGLGGNAVYMLPCATTNQNMSFIVVNSDGQIIMIDGGYEADAQNIINMVKALQPNVEKPVITAWLLTHGHIDHISAISTVLNSGEVTVNAVYHDIPSEDAWAAAKTAGYDNGSDDTDATARTNLYTALETAGLTAIRPQTGVSLTFGSATFDILYTPTDNGTFTSNYGNNTSVIYKLNTTEKDVLFLGDAGTDQGNWLLENKAEELKSDIVQMAHHGQNGVRQPVYQAIAPSIALWPTPDWVWTNRDGAGTLETLTVRGWMEALGSVNYVSKDGIIKLS